jgi:hypothetical protein
MLPVVVVAAASSIGTTSRGVQSQSYIEGIRFSNEEAMHDVELTLRIATR